MQDKLDKIFVKQSELDELIAKKKNLDIDKYSQEEWIQKKALALIEETLEVVNETNYKWWKIKNDVNQIALKQEIADILHFLISMCLTAKISSEELFDIYMDKHKENIDRQEGKSIKKGYVE